MIASWYHLRYSTTQNYDTKHPEYSGTQNPSSSRVQKRPELGFPLVSPLIFYTEVYTVYLCISLCGDTQQQLVSYHSNR